ncbi:protein kinase [Streptomyces sp. SID7813]|uniref:Serine-threonine protein kinase n=3 Tax=Streptomyces TaxID=1883 RepID=Q9XAI1_STRCO|nr:protein kinase [Streptomyces sp. SID7813]NSL79070.1 serine/threonine protein kinase [Streptomyces coelicolor]QFI43643.1 serine/threonine protein kinase [Streptomyces coelicolor A3(2)]QKN67216.1 serine/threonine protein kinase [Streptomyces coelicolor]CAB45488.1 putative serine-threonine protein kinase [Streptomyces coelicolor A3(2)]
MRRLGDGDPVGVPPGVQHWGNIGVYRLLGRLGTGGMGHVYLARSDRGRTVAVKLVREELAALEEFRERFRHEVESARRVGGHWTAPVLDADTEAAVPWVATGYVAGPSLQQVVGHDHGALPERSVRTLGAGLAHALQDIHAAGIVHRDLKPSNVLVTIDGPRVIDFGIARALQTVADGGLTRTGALVGSPGFMAPEQVRGDRVTPACDVFCLGSVLAYAATGKLPFGSANSGAHALMFRIAQEEPDLEGVPEGIADLVRDCLRKDPAARPALADVLERTGAQDTVTGGRSRDPWLPSALVAQLGRHAVQLLDTENPEDPAHPAGGPDPSRTPGAAAATPGDALPDGASAPAAGVRPEGAGHGGVAPGSAGPGGGGRGGVGPGGAGPGGVGPGGVGPGGVGPGGVGSGGVGPGGAGPGGVGPGGAGSGGVGPGGAGSGGVGPGGAGSGGVGPGGAGSGSAGPDGADPGGVGPGGAWPGGGGARGGGSGGEGAAQGADPASGGPPPPREPGSGGGAPLNHLPTQVAGRHPATPPPGAHGHAQPPAPGYDPAPAWHASQPGHQHPYDGGGGLGPTPPQGPPPPYGPPHEPVRNGRSTALLIVVALVVALGAGGSVYALMRGDDDGRAGGDPTPTRSTGAPQDPGTGASGSSGATGGRSPSTGPAADEGTVPTGYLGDWSTSIDNASGTHPRTLSIVPGEVGDTVLTLVADGPTDTGTYHCVFEAALTAEPGSGGPLRLGPSAVRTGPASSCAPGGPSTVTLRPDGSLERTSDDTGESLLYTRAQGY